MTPNEKLQESIHEEIRQMREYPLGRAVIIQQDLVARGVCNATHEQLIQAVIALGIYAEQLDRSRPIVLKLPTAAKRKSKLKHRAKA